MQAEGKVNIFRHQSNSEPSPRLLTVLSGPGYCVLYVQPCLLFLCLGGSCFLYARQFIIPVSLGKLFSASAGSGDGKRGNDCFDSQYCSAGKLVYDIRLSAFWGLRD